MFLLILVLILLSVAGFGLAIIVPAVSKFLVVAMAGCMFITFSSCGSSLALLRSLFRGRFFCFQKLDNIFSLMNK